MHGPSLYILLNFRLIGAGDAANRWRRSPVYERNNHRILLLY